MSVAAAFAAYEGVRARLPAAAAPGACRRMRDLDAIADQFDVFLLDAFGVLNIGETAIPGAPERIRGLQAAGKRVLVVTNAASYPQDQLLQKYARLGYQFDIMDVISSRAALLAALRLEPARRWGLMTPPEGTGDDFDDLDILHLGDDPAAYAAVDSFLMVGSAVWTPARQQLLEQALANHPRPVLVGNPDIVAPREAGFSIEPGFYAHQIADRLGIAPRFYGKPFDNIYDLAFARLGPCDRTRVVMVGDTLHTDVLGAQTAGVASALIAGYGFLAGQDVDAAIATSGIAPDFILDRP